MPHLPNSLYSSDFLIKILNACTVLSILHDFIVRKYLMCKKYFYYFLKKYLIIILHYHVLSQSNVSLALELQSILENLGTNERGV